jgi:hypothetical protein
VLLGGALTALVTFRRHEYAPRFVLRVIEDDRDARNMPRPPAELATYVREAIFTSEPLFELIRRHDLYPSLMRKNPRAALDSFREDIAIDVYKNFFVEQRQPGDLPRSARLSVSYRAKDRPLALAVTRELGAVIEEHELRTRRAQADDASASANETRDLAQRAVQARSEQVLQKQAEIRGTASPDPELQVELVSLFGSLGVLEKRAHVAERRAASLDLGAAFERRGIGLRFEVVEDAELPSARAQRRLDILLASGAFLLGLPLLTLAVGAFRTERGYT